MPLENLSLEERALKDQLIDRFDQIRLMIVVSHDGSRYQLNEPRVQYFNPSDCMFRISLPNHHVADVALKNIREVHLCG